MTPATCAICAASAACDQKVARTAAALRGHKNPSRHEKQSPPTNPLQKSLLQPGREGASEEEQQGRRRRKNKNMTQALIRTAVCAHTSAAMRALTQLTQAGVSVSSEPKRRHARAAASTQHNKNASVPMQKGSEGSELLCFPFFLSCVFLRCSAAGHLAFYQRLTCPKGREPADSCS